MQWKETARTRAMATSKSPAHEMGGLTLAQLSQPEISGQLFTLQPPSSVN